MGEVLETYFKTDFRYFAPSFPYQLTGGFETALYQPFPWGECAAFFEDLCTINELLSLSQRFEVAKMLREKKTYLDIAEKTGASTATISRVNRSLNYGSDGYEKVFERLQIPEGGEGQQE